MAEPTPNAKFRHVFAVVRLDEFLGPAAKLEHQFTVTKVMLTEAAAEDEAVRLNALQRDGGSRYVVHITRLDERQRECSSEAHAIARAIRRQLAQSRVAIAPAAP